MSRLLQEMIGKKPIITGVYIGPDNWEVVDVDEEWVKLRRVDNTGKEKFKLQLDLEFFATPKDVLNYINSYDEGERQANLEQSFRILFQLHQYVLPALYIFLIIISFLTGEIQLLAFLLVGAIHVYINVMQLPMVKRYFK